MPDSFWRQIPDRIHATRQVKDPICDAWTIKQEKPEVLEGLPLDTWTLSAALLACVVAMKAVAHRLLEHKCEGAGREQVAIKQRIASLPGV